MPKLPDSHPYLEHWRELAQEIERDDFELDVEAFAEIYRAYLNLQSVAYQHDVMVSALMSALAAQCASTEDGVDGGDDLQCDNDILPARYLKPLRIRGEGSVTP